MTKPEPEYVELTEMQWLTSVSVGNTRQVNAVARHYHDSIVNYSARKSVAKHWNGAAAECASAICLGIEWPMRINTYSGPPDLDPDIEVKWREKEFWIERKDLRHPCRFVFVRGIYPCRLRIVGWLPSEDVTRVGRPNIPGNLAASDWRLSDDSLRPVSELRASLVRQPHGSEEFVYPQKPVDNFPND